MSVSVGTSSSPPSPGSGGDFQMVFNYMNTTEDPLALGLPYPMDTQAILTETLFWPWYTMVNRTALSSLSQAVSPVQQFWLVGDSCIGQGANGTNGTRDCAIVCSDPGMFFISWASMMTCLTLAVLSFARPYLDDSHNQKMSQALSTIDIGIGNLTDENNGGFNASYVFDMLFTCASASCDEDKTLGSCNLTFPQFPDTYPNGKVPWHLMEEALRPLCQNIPDHINPDIGGPGAFISYIIQTSLVVYGWLLVHLLTIDRTIRGFKNISGRMLRGPKNRQTATRTVALPRLQSLVRRLQRSSLAHSTITFLTEFQEAQCFFVVAIQVALIYGNSQSVGFSGVDSWQGLFLNHMWVNFLSSMGIWLVVTTQICLYRLKLDSTYTLTLASLAGILAAVELKTSPEAQTNDISNILAISTAGTHWIDDCGGDISLRALCLDQDANFSHIAPSDIVLFPFITVLATFWCRRLWHLLTRSSWLSQMHGERPSVLIRGLSHTQQKNLALATTVISDLWKVYLVAIELWLAFFIVYVIFRFYTVAPYFLAPDSSDSWDLGQVVALLVWAPVISRYLYMAVFGIERGFAIRLSKAYAVRRTGHLFDYDSDVNADHGSAEVTGTMARLSVSESQVELRSRSNSKSG